ncbi:MAG: hypothetical protein AAGD00_09825 [Planctomycetota bacterium]
MGRYACVIGATMLVGVITGPLAWVLLALLHLVVFNSCWITPYDAIGAIFAAAPISAAMGVPSGAIMSLALWDRPLNEVFRKIFWCAIVIALAVMIHPVFFFLSAPLMLLFAIGWGLESSPIRVPSPWHCAACGYDLTGLRTSICPECGNSR